MNTKAKILILTLHIIATNIYAQKGFHAGFRAGLSSAWIINQNNARTLEDYADISKAELAYRKNFGYGFGGVIGYNFTNNYGIQTEILYDKTGQDYEDDFNPIFGPLNVKRKIDLKYASIPLVFKYISKNKENIKAYAIVGPQFNFLLNASETVVLNGVNKIDSLSATEKFRSIDLGICVGGGIDIFFLKNLYFNVGLHNYIGFSDINSDAIRSFISKNDENYKGSKNFRATLNIGVHYLFTKRSISPWRIPGEGGNKKKTIKGEG